MEKQYRIKEHLGKYKVQELIEETNEETNFFSVFMPKIFKPKITKVKRWRTLNSLGGTNTFYTPPISFKSTNEAIRFIKNLEPKYHNVELKDLKNE